jgi:hypothetical protein
VKPRNVMVLPDRRREAGRLRHRVAARRPPPHQDRDGPRDPVVHGARAGARRGAGRRPTCGAPARCCTSRSRASPPFDRGSRSPRCTRWSPASAGPPRAPAPSHPVIDRLLVKEPASGSSLAEARDPAPGGRRRRPRDNERTVAHGRSRRPGGGRAGLHAPRRSRPVPRARCPRTPPR